MEDYGGMTLAEWREMPWWPNGRGASIMAGFAGHDREIVVNIDGWDSPLEEGRHIPQHFCEIFKAELPPAWKVENRSTRIEVHPSGMFAGGYEPEDVETTRAALERVGLVVGEVYDRRREGTA
jgi:hypothetical protein